MKTIRLLKNSLSHLFRCETAASIMILCSLFFVYFSQFTFVSVMNQLRQLQQASSNYTSICITPSDSSIAADTLAFFESSPLGEMRNAFVIDLDTSGERPQMVGWKGTAFTRWHALEAGMAFFDERQVESTEHIAIMGVTQWAHAPANKRSTESPIPSLTMDFSISVRCFGSFPISLIIMWMNMETTTSLLFHIAPFCRRLRS